MRCPWPWAMSVVCALLLGGSSWACGPAAGRPTPQPTADPFAVVRATAQAAYQSGKALLDSGDVVRGCPLIDQAKTNDPDNRADIERDLERCLAAIAAAAPPTSAVPTAVAKPALPTLPAAGVPTATSAGAPTAANAPTAAAAPTTLARSTAATPATQSLPTAVAVPTSAATTTAAMSDMATYHDAQQRFSIAAPPEWSVVDQPQVLFGSGIVEFRDPSGRAALSVAVDSNGRAVSPELYAASMELAMQQQVPGYALDSVQPSTTAANPSVRRAFTFTQRDSSGRDLTTRAFQITVLRGTTPYIITASAPADQFQQLGAMFERMVDSFRFS
ncbi:MAG TPA: hypothetical protein VGL99_04140 [Chloroflexota bacterium]